MDNQKLDKILKLFADQIEGSLGNWHFVIKDVQFVCLSDALHNRMRIISPIKEYADMTKEEYHQCLEANFHSALDIKYAISGDVIWAAFIHPLQELSVSQVEDAIQQVYSAVKTFGTTYSSSNLYFPTDQDRKNRMN